MLRNLLGWLLCLFALLLGSALLRLLAVPRPLAPAPDHVYLAQLFAALIACAGLTGLCIAFLLRLPGRTVTAAALMAPALALCIWHLPQIAREPSSPTPEHYRWALMGLLALALSLAGIGWLGVVLLLPWSLGLFYLARLYY